MTARQFRVMVLALPDTEENPHFDRAAFKITGKRIFATLHEENGSVNLKLTPVDQSVFCNFGKEAVFAVPNKWGLQGWTTFLLNKVPKDLMTDALQTAYEDELKWRKK